jgi:chromosome segregation ATPase
MEGLYLFVILLVGLLAGAGAVWVLLQGRTMMAYDRARTEAESVRAELAERLRGKDEQIQALKAAHEQTAAAFAQLRQDLEASAEKRALSETERREFAAQLQAKEEQIQALKAVHEQTSAAFAQMRQEADSDAAKSDLSHAEGRELTAQLQAKDEQIQTLKAVHEQTTAAFAQLHQDLDSGTGKSDLLDAERRELAAQLQAKDEQIQTLRAAYEQTSTAFALLRQDLEALGQKLPVAAPPAPDNQDAWQTEAFQALARTVEDKIARLQQQFDHVEEMRARSSASSDALRDLGATVFERVGVLSGNVGDLRQALSRALELCNLMAGTLETHVLEPVREIKEFGRNGHHRSVVEDRQIPLLTSGS